MNAQTTFSESEPSIADDYLEGAPAIAAFLGPCWTVRKVYHARAAGQLPVRSMKGIGLYAFKSELRAALKAPETLPASGEVLTPASAKG